MNTIKYIGNGQDKDFVFNFPFFDIKDIIIRINDTQQTDKFTITAFDDGENADITYTGGIVTFDTAPQVGTVITIYRKLQLNRIYDYQPTKQIDPNNLNQDLNYLFEVMKDLGEHFDVLSEKYKQIIDMPSVKEIQESMDTIKQSIKRFEDVTDIKNTLNTKLSIDTDNLTALGMQNVAQMAMPGTKFINISTDKSATYLASGVAPANGYICIRIMQGATAKYLLIQNTTTGQEITADTTRGSGYCALTMPIAKDHSYIIQTNCTGEVNMCKFFYAQGEI